MASTLTWLHLSDLHMRRDALDDLRVVLGALWLDLPNQITEVGSHLDFLAFTGDIASSGKAEEYMLAEDYFFEPLLEITKQSKEKLFIVAGNHDVDWDLVNLINPAVPSALTSRDKVNEVLKDDAKRRLLFHPLTSYVQFVHRFFGTSPHLKISHDPPYYYVQRIVVEDCSVAVLGLNSAWLSGFTKDAEGNVNDRGSLLVGEKQIGDALREAEDATVRIALMHHPPSWLKEFDELDVRRWLRPGCDFTLRGHLHVPDFKEEKALGGETINIPAGTVYKTRDWLNGYNLVQLNLGTGRGKMILRRYSEDRHEWVKDVQSTGDDLDGIVEFDLPGPLSQLGQSSVFPAGRIATHSSVPPASLAVSPVARVLAEIEPCWLRLGRERETQLVEAFLQQETKSTLWIWGDDDCGINEFLRIVQAMIRFKGGDVICFDAEDMAFGVPVDQHYFLSKLERWVGIAPETSSSSADATIDQRLKCFLEVAESHLVKSDHRLALIFANVHLLLPAIREWCRRTLWGQMLKPLKKHGTLAIFACEGTASTCPASDQENKVYLAEFTAQDVERFLHTLLLSIEPGRIRELAHKIHSGSGDELLSPPRRVYQDLIVEAIRRGWESTGAFSSTAAPTRPATDTDHGLGPIASVLQEKIKTRSFDVFLCYNSEDRSVVKEIGECLKERGVLPWLDEWELPPGRPWQSLLEEQIKQVKSAAVFVGEKGIGPWQDMEQAAFLRQFRKRNCPVIPVILPGCNETPDLPVFLEGFTWVDFRTNDPDPLERLIWGITDEGNRAC